MTYARIGDGLLIRRSLVRAQLGEPINSWTCGTRRGAIEARIGWILDASPIRAQRGAYTTPMLIGCILGAALFLAAALLSERSALYIPAVVLIAAAVAGVAA